MKTPRAVLTSEIARLDRLTELPQVVMPRLARAIEAQIHANISAGRAPDGRAWPKTKEGEAALTNAAKAVTVSASGNTIIVRVAGVEARHDLGRIRGRVQRQIIPHGSLPAPMAAAIKRVVDEEFARMTGGAA